MAILARFKLVADQEPVPARDPEVTSRRCGKSIFQISLCACGAGDVAEKNRWKKVIGRQWLTETPREIGRGLELALT